MPPAERDGQLARNRQAEAVPSASCETNASKIRAR
jgi:hypothetical protein